MPKDSGSGACSNVANKENLETNNPKTAGKGPVMHGGATTTGISNMDWCSKALSLNQGKPADKAGCEDLR